MIHFCIGSFTKQQTVYWTSAIPTTRSTITVTKGNSQMSTPTPRSTAKTASVHFRDRNISARALPMISRKGSSKAASSTKAYAAHTSRKAPMMAPAAMNTMPNGLSQFVIPRLSR